MKPYKGLFTLPKEPLTHLRINLRDPNIPMPQQFLHKKTSLTQEQLANQTGVTRQTISAPEQNRYNPS